MAGGQASGRTINVLFAVSEAVPLAKTGGLADVAGALPKALAGLGISPAVMLPAYGEIPSALRAAFRKRAQFRVALGWRNQHCELLEAELDGVPHYLIDNDYYFARGQLYGYDDEAERFGFFCRAAVESLPHLGRRTDIIHCHDWQTGLIPYLLKTSCRDDPDRGRIRTVLTIHNLQYQGIFGRDTLADLLGDAPELHDPDKLELYGGASCLKAGLVYADKLTTVSRTYAEEIRTPAYGERLDGVLRKRSADLTGIVNGLDTERFDPLTDPALADPRPGSAEGKRRSKRALQRELGLAESDGPLLGIVSRLVEQKGFDLIAQTMGELLATGAQLVALGSGEPRYEELFRQTAAAHPDRAAVRIGFDDALARRIYAGADIYLMPSRFEPCGLSQLIAMRYGAVPVVRETGGLRDTVRHAGASAESGTGFRFRRYEAGDFLDAVRQALDCYRHQERWRRIVNNGVAQDFGWDAPAREYAALYRALER